MAAVISVLIIVLCSMIAVKVGTVALIMTGLSPEVAYLQALSAFSGVGFTTRESEMVMSQPVRRRIIVLLIMAGNAGITSTVAALVVSLLRTEREQDIWRRLAFIVSGLVILYAIAQSRWLGNLLSRVIKHMLAALTSLQLHDYELLLNISSGYGITEVTIRENSQVAGKELRELDLPRRGILVIGIHSEDAGFQGTPDGHSRLRVGDRAICYGNAQKISAWLAEIQS